MIGCLRRSVSFRSRLPLLFSKPFKLMENVQKLKSEAKKIWNEFKPNNDKEWKWINGAGCFMILSYLVYQTRKERTKQISLEQFMKVITTSQTDNITLVQYIQPFKREKKNLDHDDSPISQSQNKIQTAYTAYVSVDGVKYSTNFLSFDQLQSYIKELQANKMFKTKIFLERRKTSFQVISELVVISQKLFLPLLLPVIIFTSSLGKVFKKQILGHTEGMAKPSTLFKDIAGLGNAKIQVSELVDFLKAPKKYKDIGARVPKGALLAGPPGTGKTMLAKACAGEANVPFFSVSGSEFVELFAGMGALRVRQLFQNAKKETPAIIFIDEIDAIGRKRQDKFGGANDERANTLNQLLVEMDGFSTSDDIIILAATNRKEMLDNALTRPGRFDRIVEIDLPDLKGRKEILEIYLSKLQLSPIQSFEEYSKRIATLTFGFSGADLANLCNEAAILAVRKQKTQVQPSDFQSASDRVLAGLQQSMSLSDEEKRKVAYHECGHAVTAWFLQGAAPLLKITIIPRSKGSLGFAQYLPNESTLSTKQELLDQLCVILGGRTAEQIFFKEVSNGAADDLQKVRNLAKAIIITYGMGKRFRNYAPVKTDGHNVFSQETNAQLDKEMIQLVEEATQRTRDIINKHKDKIQGLAEAVLEKETLNHKEIREILGERPFESSENYKQFIEEFTNEKKVNFVV